MRGKATRLWTGIFLVVVLLMLILTAIRYGGERGTMEAVEYDCLRVGGKQRLVVYLPPEYPQHAPYPVLYLLHGAGDDERSWQTEGSADIILDRLIARKQIVPMMVIMPNGRGRGSNFENDLLEEVIPYVESHYAARSSCLDRAIAGLSLGGGQALSIGLKHPNRFA